MIWLIALLGLLLRAAALHTQGSYWFDEAFSVHFAAMPLPQAFGFLIRDVHPTLYYLLLHVWIRLFGAGEAMTRLLSVACGTLAVVSIGSLAKRAFGPRAGLIAAFAAALSPLLLFQSAEARMYPLLILLIALAATECLALLEDRARSPWRWLVLAALAAFTHLTALTPLVVMAGVLAYQRRHDRAQLLKFLGGCLLALVPFLAWFVTAASARLAFIGREWQLGAGAASAIPLAYHFTDFFAQGTVPWQRAFLFPILVLLLLRALCDVRIEGGLAIRVQASKDSKAWLLLALALVPFLAFVGVTTAVTKYFVVALPACLALVAGGLDRMLPRSRRALAAAGVAWALILTGSLSSLLLVTRFRFDDVASDIESHAQPGDIVYASWYPTLLPLGFYLHGTVPMYGANPYEGKAGFDQTLILHAGQSMTPEDFKIVEANLAARAGAANRVFLVTGATDLSGSPVEQWFSEHGWILEDVYRTNEWSPNVYEELNPSLQASAPGTRR